MTDHSFIRDNFLFSLPQVRTHYGCVMGSGVFTGMVAREAAKHYAAGQFSHIHITGGVVVKEAEYYHQLSPLLPQVGLPLPEDGETEAAYAERIIQAELPGIALPISREDESTNTGVSIALSLPALNKANSISFFCLAHLQRRLIGTFRLHDAHTPVTIVPTYPMPGINKDNWQDFPIAKAEVEAEVAKFPSYISQGFCRDIDLESETSKLLMLSQQRPLFGRAPS